MTSVVLSKAKYAAADIGCVDDTTMSEDNLPGNGSSLDLKSGTNGLLLANDDEESMEISSIDKPLDHSYGVASNDDLELKSGKLELSDENSNTIESKMICVEQTGCDDDDVSSAMNSSESSADEVGEDCVHPEIVDSRRQEVAGVMDALINSVVDSVDYSLFNDMLEAGTGYSSSQPQSPNSGIYSFALSLPLYQWVFFFFFWFFVCMAWNS